MRQKYKLESYTKRSLTLAANNLTAMANKTTPNTFLMILSPFLLSIFSIFEDDFNTA